MSEREQIQDTIVNFLNENSNRFSAPYGVLPNLEPVKNGKGKVRTITFGVARYLDATIFIWSPKNITVQAQGGLAYKIGGTYNNQEEVLNALKGML